MSWIVPARAAVGLVGLAYSMYGSETTVEDGEQVPGWFDSKSQEHEIISRCLVSCLGSMICRQC